MAIGRTSRVKIDQIKELKEQGESDRKIALALRVCPKTIKRYMEAASSSHRESPQWARALNWEKIVKEIGLGVPVKILWKEHGPDGVDYRRFWGECRKRVPVKKEPTIRMHYKPGEHAQVDFTDGIPIYNRETGEVEFETHLFKGVLPFSAYTFGVFVRDQRKETFIECHEKMWAAFGGVTKYVICDNLKSGVKRAHIYDPEINPTYCEYANHMEFVVLPARARRAQDKAGVERGIGIAQENFYQLNRDRKFYSLEELNQAFRTYLEELNTDVMKDYGVSRLERFQEEKKHLHPIKETKYERGEWKQVKVHADCHVQVSRCFYSVPHQHIGESVRVRLTVRMLEVFSQDNELLATHVRFREGERGKYSTNDAHYPPERVGVARFEVVHAKAAAQRIGPKTTALIEELLSGPRPLKYLRRAQGIIRIGTGGKASLAALEYACTKALQFKRSRVSFIQDCAIQFDLTGPTPRIIESAPQRDPNVTHLHNKPS